MQSAIRQTFPLCVEMRYPKVFPFTRSCSAEAGNPPKNRLPGHALALRYHYRKLPPDRLENALNAWLGHIGFGQSKRLEYTVFWDLQHWGVNVVKHPNGSWRVLGL